MEASNNRSCIETDIGERYLLINSIKQHPTVDFQLRSLDTLGAVSNAKKLKRIKHRYLVNQQTNVTLVHHALKTEEAVGYEEISLNKQ